MDNGTQRGAIRFCVLVCEGSSGDRAVVWPGRRSDADGQFAGSADTVLDIVRSHAMAGDTLVCDDAEYVIARLFWPAGEDVRLEYRAERFNHGRWFYAAEASPVQIWDARNLGWVGNDRHMVGSVGDVRGAVALGVVGGDDADAGCTAVPDTAGQSVEPDALVRATALYDYLTWYADELAQWGMRPERTIGATAAHLWLSLSGGESVELTSQRIRTLGREGYHGGRVEAFKVGRVGPCRIYDVRSMYPWAMAAHTYPDPQHMTYLACDCIQEHYVEKRYAWSREPKASCTHISDRFLALDGVAHATVYVPPMYVPPLPCLSGGRIVYPTGRFSGVFTTPELRRAVLAGCEVQAIYRLAGSQETVAPFVRYVASLYARRLELSAQQDPRETVVKALLNALYGRLGLRPELHRETVFPLPSGTRVRDWEGYDVANFGSRTVLRRASSQYIPSPHANVVWAALVCAYARLRLYDLLLATGSGLIYADTDSVVTDGFLPLGGNQPGDLRLVGEYSEGIVLGPKLYSLVGETEYGLSRVAGIPAEVQEQFIYKGVASFYAAWRPKEALAAGAEPGTWRIVSREQHLRMAPRQPVVPLDPYNPVASSDTLPLVFGPDETPSVADTTAW